MIEKLLLFIDGSTNNKLKVGCGAFLVIHEKEGSIVSHEGKVKIKTFKNTSSTKLELQTLLWALDEILTTNKKIIVYTDSQNIMGLPKRRFLLEQNDYHSSKNKLLNNHELYQAFFKLTDEFEFEFVKVKGHQATKNKDQYDLLFTLVDRAARKALKKLVI